MADYPPPLTRKAQGLSPVDSIVSLDQYEDQAAKILPKHVLDYIQSGADPGIALEKNVDDFRKVMLIPRMLAASDPSASKYTVEHRVRLWDEEFLYDPFFIAPFGLHRVAHPAGEAATFAACMKQGVAIGISQHATVALPELTKLLSDSQLQHAANSKPFQYWYQLYILRDKRHTMDLVSLAEKQGCSALVITVDSPVFGFRSADAKNKLKSLPSSIRYEHYSSEELAKAFQGKGEGMDDNIEAIFDPNINWGTIDQIIKLTTLPVIIKGIMDPKDCVIACKLGVKAVYVSSHGGRQFGSCPSGLYMVPHCKKAMTEAGYRHVPILLDGGIRSADDVLKAIRLGATAVGLGRLILYALAVDGANGVNHCLQMLRADLRRGMQLLGCESLEQVKELGMVESFGYQYIPSINKL